MVLWLCMIGNSANFLVKTIHAILSLFVILVITFFLLKFLPGGPFDSIEGLSPELVEKLNAHYKLDKPILVQFFTYLKSIFKGQLGVSYKFEGIYVSEILQVAYPKTFILGLVSIFFAFTVGLAWGLASIFFRNRVFQFVDQFILSVSMATPSFLLAPVLVYLFCLGKPLDFLWPSLFNFLQERNLLLPMYAFEGFSFYILPIIIIAFHPMIVFRNLISVSVRDTLGKDFINVARGKGVSESTLYRKHVLKKSILPCLAYLGPAMASALTGSFVVETVFSIHGVAKIFIESILSRDYSVAIALTWIFSLFLILSNLVSDFLCRFLDPSWGKNVS